MIIPQACHQRQSLCLAIHAQFHSFDLYNDKINAMIEKNLSTYKKK